MQTSDELKVQRSKLIAEARSIVDSADELSAEQQTQVDALFAQADQIGQTAATSERREKLEKAEAEMRMSTGRKTTSRMSSREELNQRSAGELFRGWSLAGAPSHRPSHDEILRAADHGFALQDQVIHYRALSKGTTTAGGYTVPQSFSDQLEKILSYYWSVEDAVEQFPTEDGTDYPWPTVVDANASSIVTEGSAIGSSTDPTFGQVVFKAFDYFSPTVKVSYQLLRDSTRDIPALLAELFAERMGRALDAAIVSTNAGSAAPEGMLYGVTAGVNLATGNPLTYAKLLELETSVPISYRSLPGVGFLMHDATWQAIRAIVDSTGRPMVNGDLQNGVEKKLLGYPVHISNNMTSISSPGDDQPLILFGALSKYKVRRVGGSSQFGASVTRLNELYAGTGQVGFVLHECYDGRWITKAGVRTLNSFDAA